MTAKPFRLVSLVIAGFLSLGAFTASAAKAPLDPGELKKQSTRIVTGSVVSVTSKTEKSKIETGPGLHRDRIYTIKLKVTFVTKGSGVKVGDEIEIIAWKPAKRIPPVVGLQGHAPIPEKGDTVTAYLKGGGGSAYEPLLPNGFEIAAKEE
jgi:hypothetical protein